MSVKKVSKLFIILLITITCLIFKQKIEVNASSTNMEQDVQKIIVEETNRLFENIEICKISYLYNLNDSPDYVYVNFKDLGYVIYYRDTLEIMEYSYEHNIEYSDDETRKYYAGPFNYYEKVNNRFVNINTGYSLNISENEIEAYACSLSALFSKRFDERSTFIVNISKDIDKEFADFPQNKRSPEFDEDDYIFANTPGSPNTTYIENHEFFFANPKYGYNEHGTCGSVAAQLLLSYNNYYNDRRIIDVEHLNGDWTGLMSDDIFDEDNYLFPNRNMNVCNDPTSLTSYTTGTNDDFYEYVIQSIEPSAFNCICTKTKVKIIGAIANVTTIV